MKIRSHLLILSLLLSFTGAVAQDTLTLDLTTLKLGEFAGIPISVQTERQFYSFPKEGEDPVLSIPVSHLPTLIQFRSYNQKKKSIPLQHVLWVEQREIKLMGTFGTETFGSSQSSSQQQFADQLLKKTNPNPKTEADLAFSPPYLVYFHHHQDFLKASYLQQLIELAPKDVQDFWAYRELQIFMEAHDAVGYDPAQKRFSHLTGTNKEKVIEEVTPQAGKYLLLDFSSSTCGYCLRAIDDIAASYSNMQDRLELVTLWQDPSHDVFLNAVKTQKDKIYWTSLWDASGGIFKAFDIRILPTYLLIDSEGNIVKKWKGKFPKNIENYL
ncbi:MAG: TlpA disulfide reductase family protein [Bacteroidota bacterium]